MTADQPLLAAAIIDLFDDLDDQAGYITHVAIVARVEHDDGDYYLTRYAPDDGTHNALGLFNTGAAITTNQGLSEL